MNVDLTDAVAAALGSAVTGVAALGGGDNARSYRVTLADGRTVFAKTQHDAPPGFFTTEAAGLGWLRDATGSAVSVPEVLAVSDGDTAVGQANHLVLAWIDEGGSGRDATEAEFGLGLAAIHRAGAPSFGREDGATTGSLGLPNGPCTTWAEFYAERRLAPLARIAREREALAPAVIAGLERVAGRLDALGGPTEPPARLHGDLWAGNRLVDRGGHNWLIDPAAHGGHREFDLAMMRLFGGFGAACFASYDDAFPLADGWRERVALHQIAPLVVHAIKFGGSYPPAAADAVAIYA